MAAASSAPIPALAAPNMQLYFQAFSTVIPKSGERPILTPDPWPGFSIGLSNCRPSSRGEIMIRSTDPRDHPKIVANAFSTEHDVAEMLAAVKFVRKIAAMPAMAEIIAEEVLPGPSITSDDDLIQDFRKRSRHRLSPGLDLPHGPGRRARRWSTRACKVHGLEGLRVIDASIFPDNISGNTNAAVDHDRLEGRRTWCWRTNHENHRRQDLGRRQPAARHRRRISSSSS